MNQRKCGRFHTHAQTRTYTAAAREGAAAAIIISERVTAAAEAAAAVEPRVAANQRMV